MVHDFHWKNMVNQSVFWCFSGLTVYIMLFRYRSHHFLKTLILLFKFVSRETKESFVTKNNALLAGTLTYLSK